MNKFVLVILGLIISGTAVWADRFVPEFDKMKAVRCDITETIYNSDDSVVTTNKYFRIFRLDDECNKIYLQKAPVDKILHYDNNLVHMSLQTLTDDSIIAEDIQINRTEWKYTSKAQISYDNPVFGVRYSKSNGVCRVLN
ncbi:hypothetical protein HDR58_02370 [bacterium]|nr:hypothetical protein [bacterium]